MESNIKLSKEAKGIFTKNPPKPVQIYANYKWIIEQIVKRNGHIDDDVMKVLNELDAEQRKDASDGK